MEEESRENESRSEAENDVKKNFCFSGDPSFEKIRQMQQKFADDRDWNQYHTPRNILLALVGEVGELAEIFQWKGEVEEGLPKFSEAERHHVGQEMGDVLLYLVRLADRCKIDLPAVALEKIRHNEEKYPADKVYGKSHKYTAYENGNEFNGADDT